MQHVKVHGDFEGKPNSLRGTPCSTWEMITMNNITAKQLQAINT